MLRRTGSSVFWDAIGFWIAKLGLKANARLFWRLFPTLPRARNPEYLFWLLRRKESDKSGLVNRPLVSVVMPVFDPPLPFLEQAIASVKAQTYDNWELCIADDASTNSAVRELIERAGSSDPRVKAIFRETNGHIVAATNTALDLARGEFVAFLDHDDVLEPHALRAVVAALQSSPGADIVYSDEDKVDATGVRTDSFFKPDWSPETLLTRMYTNHLSVFRRELVEKTGRFRQEFLGAQDYDLALRCADATNRVVHVSDVLYSWRAHAQSGSVGTAAKPYAFESSHRAIESALSRRGLRATVTDIERYPGLFDIELEPVAAEEIATVSVKETDLAKKLRQEQRKFVALVSNSAGTSGAGQLAAWSSLPGIGAAGGKSVHKAVNVAVGWFVEDGRNLVPIHAGLPASEPGYFGLALCLTDLSIPSTDLIVCQSGKLARFADLVEGFDPEFRCAAACLALRESGLRNVLVPRVLVETESASESRPVTIPDSAPAEWRRPDPYASPHTRPIGPHIHIRTGI